MYTKKCTIIYVTLKDFVCKWKYLFFLEFFGMLYLIYLIQLLKQNTLLVTHPNFLPVFKVNKREIWKLNGAVKKLKRKGIKIKEKGEEIIMLWKKGKEVKRANKEIKIERGVFSV